MSLAAAAGMVDRRHLIDAAAGTAEPFVILAVVIGAGLLADRLGFFRLLAHTLVPTGATGPIAVAGVLTFTALVSGVVNLDVAVVVAVPVALHVADRRRLPAGRLAIAAALTANAASFLLPTSNLTTLLVTSNSPASALAYLSQSWAAWLLVTGLTVGVLSVLAGRRRVEGGIPVLASMSLGASPLPLLDLIPMFVGASAIRAFLGGGVPLEGPMIEQLGAASLLAAGVNNLPAAAALHLVGSTARWPAVLGLAIGPNLILTGSVASLISRRIAHDRRVGFGAGMFTLLGGVLLPVQLLVALVGLHLTGAL